MNRSQKMLWNTEGYKGAVQPRSLKPRKNKTDSISSGSFPQLGERKGWETFPIWLHSWEATKTVYYFMQTRVMEVKWKWMWSHLWLEMHLGSVFKERKLGVALSIPVPSRPDSACFWVQFNFGREDEYVCCLGQGTHGTLQKQQRRRKKKVLLKT